MTYLREFLMVTGLVWWVCAAALLVISAAGSAYSAAHEDELSDLVISDLVVGRDEFGNEVCFPRTTGPGSSDGSDARRTPGLVANLFDPDLPDTPRAGSDSNLFRPVDKSVGTSSALPPGEEPHVRHPRPPAGGSGLVPGGKTLGRDPAA